MHDSIDFSIIYNNKTRKNEDGANCCDCEFCESIGYTDMLISYINCRLNMKDDYNYQICHKFKKNKKEVKSFTYKKGVDDENV